MLKTQSIFHAIRTMDLREQYMHNRVPLALAGSVGALAIVGIWILSSVTGVDLSDLTRDPNAVTDTHLYVGALSTTGLMLWAAAAGVCLLGAANLFSLPHHRSAAWFLLSAAHWAAWSRDFRRIKPRT